MNDLHTQLVRNYEEHSKFQFSSPSWQLDAALLISFTTSYEAVRTFGASLSKSRFSDCKTACQNRLDNVFAALKSQSKDEQESLFLDELQGECRRLLIEELDSYYTPPAVGSVAFAAEQARDDALLLAKQRHYFGRLPDSAVKEILDICAADLSTLRRNAEQGRLKREDLSVNSGSTIRQIIRVLNREYRALGVLDAVSAYTGSNTSVSGLALELSVPQASWWANSLEGMERPPKTLYAHLDESIKYPKSIVYLSEVNETNGPTSCYPHAYEQFGLNPLQDLIGRIVGNVGSGVASALRPYYAKQYHQSMSSERFREHFMRLPASIRFNSHMGWDVAPGSDLEESLACSEVKMIGKPGTFIIFDGARLLHRGGLVRNGERLALQVIFSNETLTTRAFSKLKRALQ